MTGWPFLLVTQGVVMRKPLWLVVGLLAAGTAVGLLACGIEKLREDADRAH
jgi:hypothetical protein